MSNSLLAEYALVPARRHTAAATHTERRAAAFMLVRILEVTASYVRVVDVLGGMSRHMRATEQARAELGTRTESIYQITIDNDTIVGIASR